MQKLIASFIFLILFSIPAIAQNIKVAGIASKGGKIVRTSAQVQHTLVESYPSSTVTVYLTGTLTLASIFSDEAGTPKSNPFAANSDASWFFYVAAGRYDIKFSGTGILVPFTISDVFVNEGGGGGGGAVTSWEGRTGAVVVQTGDVEYNQLDFTGSNFNSISVRSASDLSSGTLPDARFPATLPAISGANLTNLNAAALTGTIDDARLSSNVPLKNTVNTFTQNNIFTASVGINTTTPRRRLDVLDGSNAQIRLSAVDNTTYTDLFVDSGGTLNVLPTGNVAFDSTGNQVNPLNNFDQNLGQINKKWLSLHAAELFVETLVAQNTIATIGGRIIVAPTNILIADLSSAATTINVKYNNLNNGDRIYMEGNNSVEFFAVTSGASVIAGGFSYTVTRNLDGTGANDWFAGDAMVNTGVSGNGFIDLYSVRGVKSGTQAGPTIVGNIRNSTTFNDWTENWAIGNLNGLYGYGADTYGAAFGKYAAGIPHITVDNTNGIRIYQGLSTLVSQWHPNGNLAIGEIGIGKANVSVTPTDVSLRVNTTEKIKLNSDGSGFLANTLISWDTSGNLNITGNAVIGGVTIGSGKMFVGAGNFNNADTSFYVDGAGQFSLKDKLSWNNTTLTISGNIALSSLTSTLSLSGASSAISIGTTPPTSASSGTGIWLDRTGLYTLNTNVVQAKMDAATGKLIAGAGEVVIDSRGISINSFEPLIDQDYLENSSYNFRDDDSTLVAAMYHAINPVKGASVLSIENLPFAGSASNIEIFGRSPASLNSSMRLRAIGDNGNSTASIQLSATPSSATISFSGLLSGTQLSLNTSLDDGSLKIGAGAFATNGDKGIAFGDNGASNPTMTSNSAGIFAKDVSGTVEMFSIDEAGNVTQISPHESNSDKWIFYSCNNNTKRCIKVDMEKLVNTVEKLSGEHLMKVWKQ